MALQQSREEANGATTTTDSAEILYTLVSAFSLLLGLVPLFPLSRVFYLASEERGAVPQGVLFSRGRFLL